MTPRAYILHLIKTITDDAAIAQMCRDKFGNEVTAERVAELRRGVRPFYTGEKIGAGRTVTSAFDRIERGSIL